MRTRLLVAAALLAWGSVTACAGDADSSYRVLSGRLMRTGLGRPGAFSMLRELCARAPRRLSGSAGADTAVLLTEAWMSARGFRNVHLERVMVPRWVRGPVEKAVLQVPGRRATRLAVTALGGSVATPKAGITARVIECKSFDELKREGRGARGKIVFFNRPMDPEKLNTFEAYGGAVDQRSRGAIEAAKVGAVAVLVRSMSLAIDNVPHTGSMGYQEGVAKIPAAAISTADAERLGALIASGARPRVTLTLSSRTLADVPSANVVGEIPGRVDPADVIVIGGHLDAWDTGEGAHDDGAGCVQAIEALDLLLSLHMEPRRTIRAVMFMNEENGLRGGRAYAADARRRSEHPVAMIESDAGGFAPRGFSVDADSAVRARVGPWGPVLETLGAGTLSAGRSGVDISPMVALGVPGFGLTPENQRYFDYHHSAKDIPANVNPRELELGAVAEALLAWMISEEGL